jgi:magnesium transporter
VHGSLESLLKDVRSLLERQRVVEALVARQTGPNQEILQTMTHRQHLAEIRTRLTSQHPADIAFVLESLPVEERSLVWSQIWPIKGSTVLLELGEKVRAGIVNSMPRDRLVELLQKIPGDDLPDLAATVPEDVLEEVYATLDSQSQDWLVSSIAYPADSVGALMSQKAVTARPEKTVREVIEDLRARSLPPALDTLYVIDSRHTLLGALSLTQILISNLDSAVRDIQAPATLAFTPHQEALEAVRAFERYDLRSAPVVDERARLLGYVTVDVVMDYARRKSGEEALRLAGLHGEEDLFAPLWASARNRWLWLGLNLVTALVASRVIGMFEQTISRLVALAALMPIVASIGGNTGNQTMALIVRTLATSPLPRSNAMHLLLKELRIALLNGLVWGGIMGILTIILYGSVPLGAVMSLSMTLNLLVAAAVGVLVPLLLDRLGFDPAQGSSVLLTFTTDSMGFLIFLGLASGFLL